jgi:hypothetical protein
VPDQSALDLGSRLVFRFVREVMPADYDAVAEIFRRRGAYSRYKDLLDRRGMLQRWYDYENDATREALLAWAAECGIEVTGVPKPG